MTQPPPRKFSGIFISYRREDSAGHAGRLYDRLFAHFGPDHLFMDVDRIEPGEDFVQVIETAVGSCDVVLVIIGRRWLTAGDGNARRLDNPKDFVRLEIATALKRDVRVIPVLVADATMPGEHDLPADLAGLSRRNAVELSDLRWNRDVQQLIQVLDKFLASVEAERRAAREADERRQRAAEDEARRRQEENQRRVEQARAAQAAEGEGRRKESEAHRRYEAEAQRRPAEESARRRDEAERQRAAARPPAARETTPSAWWAASAPPRAGKPPRPLVAKPPAWVVAAVLCIFILAGVVLAGKWLMQVTPLNRAQTNAAVDMTPQPGGGEKITAALVNLRAGPGPSNEKVGVIEAGSRVRVLRIEGSWVEIEIVQRGYPRFDEGGAERGWVNVRFLQ